MFFTFPENARWDASRQAVEVGVAIGEYEGVVRVGRHVFRRFVDSAVTPERCVEAYHCHRTRLECIVWSASSGTGSSPTTATSRSPAATSATRRSR